MPDSLWSGAIPPGSILSAHHRGTTSRAASASRRVWVRGQEGAPVRVVSWVAQEVKSMSMVREGGLVETDGIYRRRSIAY